MGDDDAEEEDRSQDLGPHFVRAFAVEMHVNISEEPLYTEIYSENAAAQIEPRTKFKGPHFARACAIEMHFNMSQEPLYTEIFRKNATPQNEPRTWTHILCEPAQSKSMSRPYRKNAAAQNQPRMQTHTLCKPVRSKCTATCHKSHFIRKFTGKMPQTRVSTLIKPRPLQLP